MPLRKTLGFRIAQARRELAVREGRDITKAMLASAAGVDPSAITLYESDKSNVSEGVLARLADYLGVTPAFLRYGVMDAKIPASPSAGSVEPDPDLDYKFTDEDRARDEAVVAARKTAKAAKQPRRRA